MNKRILLLAFCILSCFIAWKIYQHQEAKDLLPTRESLIQKDFERKLNDYAQRMREKCDAEVLKLAKKNADSIVFIKANELMLFDSLRRPEKPLKPELPIKKELKDSVKIEPLVKF